MSIKYRADVPTLEHMGGGNYLVLQRVQRIGDPGDPYKPLWVAINSEAVNVYESWINPLDFEAEIGEFPDSKASFLIDDYTIPFDEWEAYEWPEMPFRVPEAADQYYQAIKIAYHAWQWIWSQR